MQPLQAPATVGREAGDGGAPQRHAPHQSVRRRCWLPWACQRPSWPRHPFSCEAKKDMHPRVDLPARRHEFGFRTSENDSAPTPWFRETVRPAFAHLEKRESGISRCGAETSDWVLARSRLKLAASTVAVDERNINDGTGRPVPGPTPAITVAVLPRQPCSIVRSCAGRGLALPGPR